MNVGSGAGGRGGRGWDLPVIVYLIDGRDLGAVLSRKVTRDV